MGRQLRLNLERSASFRRADFVVSPSNEEAVAALDMRADWFGGVLALVGPEGSGKTHLATDWAERQGAVFLSDVAAEVADLHELDGQPIVVDDAEKVDDETLFHLINQASQDGGGLLLTSRTRPQAWSVELPDLRSRLDALQVATLGAPDDVVLFAVLDRFFRRSNIRPPVDLLEYLVRRIERSVPKAREIVHKLDEAAAADHRPITRALAKEILESEQSFDLFEE